jgi:hypothetical protein
MTTLSGLLLGLQSRMNAHSSDGNDSTYGMARMGDTVRECQVILKEVADKLDGVSVDLGEGQRIGTRKEIRMGVKRAV